MFADVGWLVGFGLSLVGWFGCCVAGVWCGWLVGLLVLLFGLLSLAARAMADGWLVGFHCCGWLCGWLVWFGRCVVGVFLSV